MKTTFLLLLFSCCFGLGKSNLHPSNTTGKPNLHPSNMTGKPSLHPSNTTNKTLKISLPEFLNSVNSTINVVEQVISIVSGIHGSRLTAFKSKTLTDSRFKNAVTDCIELMQSSVDHLTSTIYAFQNQTTNSNNPNDTGSLSSDLKTWLSAALTNQDTCKEGLNGTSTFMNLNSLDQITSLVHGLLSNITTNSSRSHRRQDLIPPANRVFADVVVAADGSGNYTTIGEAVDAAPEQSTKRYIIYVKKGLYRENVEIDKDKWNIVMIGDGIDITVISSNRSVVDGWTTFRSATFAVKGKGFVARDMTFQNTAGPEKHQAVAFRSDSDLSALHRCAFRGHQDTLYVHTMRQFFRECVITGTVDFIFGDAAVVFQNCTILAREGLPNQKNTITAQGRKEPVEDTGFSIQFCNISVEAELVNSTVETYLGRPWKAHSRTVVMQSHIGGGVRPEGWLEWNATEPVDGLFYGEYMNSGPGSVLGRRVGWAGFHVFNSSVEVSNFTVSEFIFGDVWLPLTGVNYTPGLSFTV